MFFIGFSRSKWKDSVTTERRVIGRGAGVAAREVGKCTGKTVEREAFPSEPTERCLRAVPSRGMEAGIHHSSLSLVEGCPDVSKVQWLWYPQAGLLGVMWTNSPTGFQATRKTLSPEQIRTAGHPVLEWQEVWAGSLPASAPSPMHADQRRASMQSTPPGPGLS